MSVCPVHNEPWKTIPSGKSKKPPYNDYPSFQVCPHFGCKLKPDPNDIQSPILDMSEPIDRAISQSPQRTQFEQPKDIKPDWDAISRGKVRNSVAVAYIAKDNTLAGDEDLTKATIKEMERWVDYIMEGK